MLRWLLVALIVVNLGVWAWTQPTVAQRLGLRGIDPQREPERLSRQVQPESLTLLDVPAAASAVPAAAASAPASAETVTAATAPAPASAPPAAGTLCLQTGPLGEASFGEMTRQLQQAGLRSDRWVDIRRELPGRWAVYMGRFADAEALQRKLEEVRRLRLPYEELVNHPALSPGLTLGQFSSDAEAEARLAQLQQRGVRTARVVTLIEPAVEHRLRLEALSTEQAAQVRRQRLANAWSACPAP